MIPKRKGIYKSIDLATSLHKKFRELFLFISLMVFSGALFIKVYDMHGRYLEITILSMINYNYIAIISLIGLVFIASIYFSIIKIIEIYKIRQKLIEQTHTIKLQLQETVDNLNEIFETMAHN